MKYSEKDIVPGIRFRVGSVNYILEDWPEVPNKIYVVREDRRDNCKGEWCKSDIAKHFNTSSWIVTTPKSKDYEIF